MKKTKVLVMKKTPAAKKNIKAKKPMTKMGIAKKY